MELVPREGAKNAEPNFLHADKKCETFRAFYSYERQLTKSRYEQ